MLLCSRPVTDTCQPDLDKAPGYLLLQYLQVILAAATINATD